MGLPFELKQLIEENAALWEHKKLLPAAEKISERYRSESINGGRAASSGAETAAYSVTRMPATCGAVHKALSLSYERIGEIKTLLDVGAGTGAACWAAAEVFGGLERVLCLEREKEMLRLGSFFMEKGGFPAEFQWEERDISADGFQTAELVTASYVLNELIPRDRITVTDKLWAAAEKALVIIEPGTMSGYRNILSARERLLSLGAKIAAPCPHTGKCPLAEDDWCHFTVRVPRSKLHKQLKNADVPYEDEKFCFITAVRGEAAADADTARVLRHPLIESGKITLSLCTKDGLCTKTVTKKDGALFKKARKTECGDAFGIGKG